MYFIANLILVNNKYFIFQSTAVFYHPMFINDILYMLYLNSSACKGMGFKYVYQVIIICYIFAFITKIFMWLEHKIEIFNSWSESFPPLIYIIDVCHRRAD